MSENQITPPMSFQKGKKPREQHNLPILYFPVADDWIDKLGKDAFCSWLKFYSWCDRSNDRYFKEDDAIPSSLAKVQKRLGVGKNVFYNKIIKPLWNYGLIDIAEYGDSKQEGTKPLNILVYEYPQNDKATVFSPLEKIRDYDTDYHSESRTFAKSGGRRKKEEDQKQLTIEDDLDVQKQLEDLSKQLEALGYSIIPNESLGGSILEPGGFHMKTPPVPNENPGGSKMDHNNVSNIFINDSNVLNNDSKINNDSNLSILDIGRIIEESTLPPYLARVLKEEIDRLMEFNISVLEIETHFNAVMDQYSAQEYGYVMESLLKQMKEKPNSWGSVMKNWLERNRNQNFGSQEDSGNGMRKPIRKEIDPEWHKNEQNQQEASKISEEDLQKSVENLAKYAEEVVMNCINEMINGAKDIASLEKRVPVLVDFEWNEKFDLMINTAKLVAAFKEEAASKMRVEFMKRR